MLWFCLQPFTLVLRSIRTNSSATVLVFKSQGFGLALVLEPEHLITFSRS